VQVAPDRREGHVDDRRVDHDHELRHRQQQEREVLRAWRVQRSRWRLAE
jgi:hypothetical protein